MRSQDPADDERRRGDRAALFKALAHPIRLDIISAARESPLSASALAAASPESLGTIAYHFRLLADTGLIEVVRTEQRRGSLMYVYALSEQGRAVAEWFPTAPADSLGS